MEKATLLRLKKQMMHFPALAVSFCLVFPLIFFLFQTQNLAWPDWEIVFTVLFWTGFQAFVSIIIVCILSLFGLRGLLAYAHKKYYFLIEALVLLPSLLPPLLLVLSVVHWVEWVTPFPFGLSALIFTQILTYTGLCSIVLTRVLLKEASSLSEWAFVQGLKPFYFLKLLCQSLLKKDLQTIFILLFVSAFTSLSLPLLTAGGQSISLEFFIYQKLKDPTLWPLACTLILIQTILVFLIYFKGFSYSFLSSLHFQWGKIYLLPQKGYLSIPLLPVLFSLGGLCFVSQFKDNVLELFRLSPVLKQAFLSSLFLGLAVGFVVLIFLAMMAYSVQSLLLRRFIVSYFHTGITLIGFVFLVIPFYSQEMVFLKWVIGLSLLFFPLVYRLRGEVTLNKLKDQVEVGQLLGASSGFIFKNIIWPQSRGIFFFCSGIAGFLACGDFAYSLIVSQGHWNLSLMVYDLFSSYRLDLAILGSWLLLLLSFFVLLFWLGVGIAFNKKFKIHY